MQVVASRPLVGLPAVGETRAVMIEDWHVGIGGVDYVVPRGAATDGASIPDALSAVCGSPMQVPRLYAAAWHDLAYDRGFPGMTRREADACYRELLVHFWRVPYMTDGVGRPAKGLHARVHNAVVAVLNGIARVCAWTEWAALRLFGGGHWRA